MFALASSRLERIRQQWCQIPVFKAIADRESQLDRDRRSIEDRLLANLLDDSITSDTNKFAKSIESLEQWTDWFARALRSHERAIAEIPSLYRACDVLDAIAIHKTSNSLSTRMEKIAEG